MCFSPTSEYMFCLYSTREWMTLVSKSSRQSAVSVKLRAPIRLIGARSFTETADCLDDFETSMTPTLAQGIWEHFGIRGVIQYWHYHFVENNKQMLIVDEIRSSGGVVVKLLACGARGPGFDWLSPAAKSRYGRKIYRFKSDVNIQTNQTTYMKFTKHTCFCQHARASVLHMTNIVVAVLCIKNLMA